MLDVALLLKLPKQVAQWVPLQRWGARLAALPGPPLRLLFGPPPLRLGGPGHHKAVLDLASQYGGIFAVPGSLTSAGYVVVTDPQIMQQVVMAGPEPHAELPKSPSYYKSIAQAARLSALPTLYTGPSDDTWRALHRALLPRYSPALLQSDFEVRAVEMPGRTWAPL